MNHDAIVIPRDKSNSLRERQTEKQKKRKKTSVQGQQRLERECRFCLASLRVEETIEPPTPTRMISPANCLLCGPSGGDNCFFSPLFGSLSFSLIWKYPPTSHRCTGVLFELASFKQRGSILQGPRDSSSDAKSRELDKTGGGSGISPQVCCFSLVYKRY